MADMTLEEVDLSEHRFIPPCEGDGCDQPAAYIAKGCMDKHPVLMCERHLDLGIDRIKMVVHMYQQLNKKVMICGDCHRPLINLETHLDVRKL